MAQISPRPSPTPPAGDSPRAGGPFSGIGWPVLLGAPDEPALRAEAADHARFLRRHPHLEPGELADILATVRTPGPHRALLLAGDRDELIAGLDSVARGAQCAGAHEGIADRRRLAMVFPGQGGQRAGMGRMLYRESPVYRDAVTAIGGLIRRRHGVDILRYLLDEGAPEQLRVLQPAAFAHSVALLRMWESAGVHPDLVIGHSQGEIAAAYAAGAITLEQAAFIVSVRADEVQLSIEDGRVEPDMGMAVIGASRDAIERRLPELEGWADVSVVNAPRAHAVSGSIAAIEELVAMFQEEGVFARRIAVDFAGHTHIVGQLRDGLVARFREGLPETFPESRIPCIGGTCGREILAGEPMVRYWYANVRARVRFDLAVRRAVESGADAFIEVADHPALLVAIRENLRACGAPAETVVVGTSRREATDLGMFAENAARALTRVRHLVPPASATPPRIPVDLPPRRWAANRLWEAPGPGTPGLRGLSPRVLTEEWIQLGAHRVSPPRRIQIRHAEALGIHVADLAEALTGIGAVMVDRDMDADCIALAVDAAAEPTGSWVTGLLEELTGAIAAAGAGGVRIVTTGAEPRAGRRPAATAALAAAIRRCRDLGTGQVPVRYLDLDPDEPVRERAGQLAHGLHLDAESEVAWFHGAPHVRRLRDRRDVPARGVPGGAPADAALVIGGTGVVGGEMIRRLAELGVRTIRSVSRSGASSVVRAGFDSVQAATGAVIEDVCADIADPEALTGLLRGLDGGSVLLAHCAVDYGPLLRLGDEGGAPGDWDRAAAVKAGSLAALGARLRDGDRILVSSSLSAGIGARGHEAYAAVNRLQELSVAELPDGVSATVVRWGLWPGTDATAVADVVAAGFREMDPASAIDAALGAGPGVVTIASADWDRVGAAMSAHGAGAVFAELRVEADEGEPAMGEPDGDPRVAAAPESGPGPGEPGPEPAPGAGPVAGEVTGGDAVTAAVRRSLGYPPGQEIDERMPLVSLGLDSLQALELQEELAGISGGAISAAGILGGASLADLIGAIEQGG